MRDFDESNITEAVLQQFDGVPDLRLKRIMASLVRHLHDFVRDVEPSFEEWAFAIDFLTRTGRMCSDTRQEFILLSDTLGVSMLVDAINHRMPEGTTETTVLGPFYVEGVAEQPLGTDISHGIAGETLLVEGTVASSDGTPLAGAIVDVWQSDGNGYYDVQRPDFAGPHLRGRFRTDGDGSFRFRTIMPSYYPIPHDGPVGQMLAATKRHPNRPAHIHFMIAADGYETLITHIFAADSPYLDSDAVFGVKSSLIAEFSRRAAGAGQDRAHRHLAYDFGLKPIAAPEMKPAQEIEA